MADMIADARAGTARYMGTFVCIPDLGRVENLYAEVDLQRS